MGRGGECGERTCQICVLPIFCRMPLGYLEKGHAPFQDMKIDCGNFILPDLQAAEALPDATPLGRRHAIIQDMRVAAGEVNLPDLHAAR